MPNSDDTLYPGPLPSSGRAISVQRPESLEPQNGKWTGPVPLPPASPSEPFNAFAYLHAFRRHWVVASFVGLPCAAAIGLAVWFFYGPSFESCAYLRVAASEHPLVFTTAVAPLNLGAKSEFEIFRNTQQQYLKSRYVLTAALRRPEVKRLNLDQRETDPVGWLGDRLRVRFPGDGEIMEVSIVRPDRDEAKALVTAVIEAYTSEVVDVERTSRKARLNDLDRAFTEKEADVRKKRTALKELAETLGTSDTKAISLKQQVALEQFAEFQKELMRTQIELRKAKGDLDAQKAMLASIGDMPIPAFEVENYLRNDPQAKQLAEQLGLQKMSMAYTEGAAVPGSKSRYTERYKNDLARIQEQYAQFTESTKEGVRDLKRAEIEKKRLEKELEVATLAAQEIDFTKDVEKKRQEAEKLSGSSVEFEMMQSGIVQLEQTLNSIAAERDKLQVELRSPQRITMIQPADRPEAPILVSVRAALAALGAIVGLCVPLGLVVLWDVRKQKINSSAELKAMGLSVVGSVPAIPARAIRRLGSGAQRHQVWHMRLTESIDTIAARLHRRAAIEQRRVILVSSATSGEGKTTLATQLALSFARSGRRTVLVDFDLRRPAIDGVFGQPLEPGVSDLLRGGCEMAEALRETASEHLSVIPAGRWDRQALAALANGAAGVIFDKLRADYEFVVIDSSPVLSVADTRFVSQHVDAAILCVFRDLSETPKVQSAHEILEAFGVHTVDVIVTGPGEHVHHNEIGKQSRAPA